jgi:uncharacterized protein DUF6011
MTQTRDRWKSDPATTPQVELLERLIAERTVDGFVDETGTVSAVVAAYEIIKSSPEAKLTKGSVGRMIDALIAVRVPRAPKVTATASVTQGVSVPLGTYTVVLGDEDDYVTMRVDRAAFVKDANKTMISYLCGSDNELSYKGFAFVDERGVHVWSRYRSESRIVDAANVLWSLAQKQAGLTDAHETFLKYAEAYAMQSGKCARCRRTLTVPASLHRGLGPDCAQIEGLW